MFYTSGLRPAKRPFCVSTRPFSTVRNTTHSVSRLPLRSPAQRAWVVTLMLAGMVTNAMAAVSYNVVATSGSFSGANQQVDFTHSVTNQSASVLYGLTINKLTTSKQVCHIDSLWPGATATCNSSYFTNQQNVNAGQFSITAQIVGNGISSQSVSATVVHNGGGSSSSGNNPSTPQRNVANGQLELQGSGQLVRGSDGVASVGDRLSLTFVVRNPTSTNLSGVRVALDRFGYQCSVGGLSAGTETTCSGSYYLQQSDVGADLSSSATLSSDQGLSGSASVNVSNSGAPAPSNSNASAGSDSGGGANSGGFNLSVNANVLPGGNGVIDAGDQLQLSVDLSNNTGNTYLNGVYVSDFNLSFYCSVGSLYRGSSSNCSSSYTLSAADVANGSIQVNLTADSNETNPVSASKTITLPTASSSSNTSGSPSSSSSSGGSSSGGSSSGSSSGNTAGGSVAAGPQYVSECGVSSATGQNRVVVNPGDNLAAVVNSASAGAEIYIKAGTHYTNRITPKNDQKFICETGARISGANLLTGTWYQENNLWYLDNVPAAQYGNGPARSGRDINKIRNDLFIDDQLLLRVDSKSKVDANAKYLDGELIYAGKFYQSGNRIYTAINPNGKKVEYSMREWAFFSPKYYGDRVTIENCTVEKWASNDIGAAISAKETRDWTLRNVTARFNHTGGLQVGSNTKVYCGNYSKNGQTGINGSYVANNSSGEVYSYSDNVLINGAEVAYNNWAGYDQEWHASGIKFFETENVTIVNSNIHHNYGVGVWADWDAYNVNISNNNIYDNASRGILLEAVFNGQVKNNKITCNAKISSYSTGYNWFWGSQIMLKNSPSFEIANNDIQLRYGQAWGLLDNQYRGYSSRYGARRSTNVQVHDNRIVFAAVGTPSSDPGNYFHQRVGIESDQGAKNAGLNVIAGDANNSVYSNTYVMADPDAQHWRIDGTSYSSANIPGGWESGSSFQTSGNLGSICN